MKTSFRADAVEASSAVREIILGSNDGLRTVKLRQPRIVWRARRPVPGAASGNPASDPPAA